MDMDMDKGCCNHDEIREAVCIETKKIYDSCRDRDCLEDLRVYLTGCGQEVIDRAVSIKAKKAEVLWVYVNTEPVGFNKGYYQVDIHYYFKVTFDVYCAMGRPFQVEGVAVYDKKAIMFGSEGTAKIFSSLYKPHAADMQYGAATNMPEVSVEVVEPIILGSKLVEPCERMSCCCDIDVASLPEAICCCFDEPLVCSGNKRLYVSLGIFTIIRLSRNVQMLIPAYDFCIPDKESDCNQGDAPCDLFKKFKFPVDEFFPPKAENSDGKDCFGK